MVRMAVSELLPIKGLIINDISHDVAPRPQFQKTFARVYSFVEGSRSSRVNPQELALVFIMLAQGTTYNIEMAYDAVAAERWLHLSEAALVRGDFLSNNTVAGLQTMVCNLALINQHD